MTGQEEKIKCCSCERDFKPYFNDNDTLCLICSTSYIYPHGLTEIKHILKTHILTEIERKLLTYIKELLLVDIAKEFNNLKDKKVFVTFEEGLTCKENSFVSDGCFIRVGKGSATNIENKDINPNNINNIWFGSDGDGMDKIKYVKTIQPIINEVSK